MIIFGFPDGRFITHEKKTHTKPIAYAHVFGKKAIPLDMEDCANLYYDLNRIIYEAKEKEKTND